MIANESAPSWAGILAALWTPTDPDGRLLEGALRRQIDFSVRHGVHGLMVLGSTGEFVHLGFRDRIRVLEIVAEAVRDHTGLRLVANVSDIRPRATADLAQAAEGLGYHAVACLPPWFFPLSQADLLAFFVQLSQATRLPVFLYNFPERTGHRLGLDLVSRFADTGRMAGIKQSGAEFAYHQELIDLGRRKNFVVFSGSDHRLTETLAMGCAGCVGGCANFVPELMAGEFAAVQRGDWASAQGFSAQLKSVIELCDTITFPLNVAAGIEARGLDPGVPKQVVSAETHEAYAKLVAQFRERFESWKLLPA